MCVRARASVCACGVISTFERLGLPDRGGGAGTDNKVTGRGSNQREKMRSHSHLKGFPLDLKRNAFFICYGLGCRVAKMFPLDGLPP